jgi:cysteine-rich repeat protein
MRALGLLCVVTAMGCGPADSERGNPAATRQAEDVALAPICGNGVREAGEQCDDGGLVNLDGCRATCQFEQVHRINYLLMQFGGDALCPWNALGGAIVGSEARNQVQNNLNSGIADGSLTALLQMMGLDDLTGNDDAALGVGVLGGAPIAGIGYDGNNDLDWWYQVDASTIDLQRNPVSVLPGSIAGRVLTTQPTNVAFSSSDGPMRASNAWISVTTGAATPPLTSAGAARSSAGELRHRGRAQRLRIGPAVRQRERQIALASAGSERASGGVVAELLRRVRPVQLLARRARRRMHHPLHPPDPGHAAGH